MHVNHAWKIDIMQGVVGILEVIALLVELLECAKRLMNLMVLPTAACVSRPGSSYPWGERIMPQTVVAVVGYLGSGN